jgi:transposase
MTAYRSRKNYERFRSHYREAIVDRFTKVYAVGRMFSKVTALQFEMFINRVNAPLKAAPPEIARLFNPSLTEKVWIPEECALDCSILREKLRGCLKKADFWILIGTDMAMFWKSSAWPVIQTARQIPNGRSLNLYCPPSPTPCGVGLQHSRCCIINGILYIIRTGGAWRMMPNDLPHWKTCYHYFRLLGKQGHWERNHTALRDAVRLAAGKKKPRPLRLSIVKVFGQLASPEFLALMRVRRLQDENDMFW